MASLGLDQSEPLESVRPRLQSFFSTGEGRNWRIEEIFSNRKYSGEASIKCTACDLLSYPKFYAEDLRPFQRLGFPLP